MAHDPKEILLILDRCCQIFSFPILDHPYVYLAATRLTAYRSTPDWALVIEVFGYAPRAGIPEICIQTFASHFQTRGTKSIHTSEKAHEIYLANHPNDDSRYVYPIDQLSQDPENEEFVSDAATTILLRDIQIDLPGPSEYKTVGIELMEHPKVRVFELCRYLAQSHRAKVLATPEERRVSVLPEMEQILQLEEWHHPDVGNNELLSNSEAFQQLAAVMASGNPSLYKPTEEPNTHWSNWPEGGTL